MTSTDSFNRYDSDVWVISFQVDFLTVILFGEEKRPNMHILHECFIKYLEKVELQSYSIIKTKDVEYQSNSLVVGTRVMYYTLYLD